MKISKTILLAAAGFLGAAAMLPAQFNPLPPPLTVTTGGSTVDTYADLIASQGWSAGMDTSTWGTPAPSNALTFDPFGTMNVVFIGEGVTDRNDFGIHWGVPEAAYGNNHSTFENSETLFQSIRSPDTISSGHFVNIPLGGNDSFDFWISSEIRRTSPLGGIWSLFNPDLNTGNIGNAQAVASTEVVGGQTYHLFALQNWNQTSENNGDSHALMFFLHFSEGDNREGAGFTPVPEPSVYGLVGALLLGGLILRRRWRKN